MCSTSDFTSSRAVIKPAKRRLYAKLGGTKNRILSIFFLRYILYLSSTFTSLLFQEYGYIKHLLLQCITTPPERVLHVARAQNRPVAACYRYDIVLASNVLVVKKFEGEKCWRLASCDLVSISKPTTAGSTVGWEVALKCRVALCLYMDNKDSTHILKHNRNY